MQKKNPSNLLLESHAIEFELYFECMQVSFIYMRLLDKSED